MGWFKLGVLSLGPETHVVPVVSKLGIREAIVHAWRWNVLVAAEKVLLSRRIATVTEDSHPHLSRYACLTPVANWCS